MDNKPIAYINIEERKLEWAEPIKWYTPTIAKLDRIPLYVDPKDVVFAKEPSDNC
jgi:hypothetical protein